MTTPQPSKPLHVLCHEHHVEMRMDGAFRKREDVATQTSAYACPKADCSVRYTVSNGYFHCAKPEEAELDMLPHLRCPRDGRPMYLAQTYPEKRALRLWRCPQCDSARTNEEDLVNHVS